MIRKIVVATVIATASLSFATFAQAEDFPAAPMNSGPMKMTGMGPMGDLMNLGMTPMNMMAQPAAGPGPAEPMPAPMMKKHHHMKHMMKKEAM